MFNQLELVDHIWNDFREKAGGGDCLNVEKTLKQQAKVEARKSKEGARKEKARDESAKSLFDFINVKLGGKRGSLKQVTSWFDFIQRNLI